MIDNALTPYAPQVTYLAEIERDPHLRSLHTRRQYKSALSHFETWRASRPLTKTLVEEYFSLLQRRALSPATLKQTLASIRWWARRVVDLAYEQLPREQAEEIARQAQRVVELQDKDIARGERLPAGRHLPEEDLAALIHACTDDPTPAGTRDAALVTLAIQTGARNEEIRDIVIDDLTYTDEGADLLIRHGKGDKQRLVFMFDCPLAALNKWIDLRGAYPGPIFCQVLKNGKIIPGGTISYEATRKILHKRFKQSALAERTTWHDFRRTLAGLLFEAGEDISTIQNQFGHASPATTKRYDRRPEERRRLAIKSIHVPIESE